MHISESTPFAVYSEHTIGSSIVPCRTVETSCTCTMKRRQIGTLSGSFSLVIVCLPAETYSLTHHWIKKLIIE